MSDLKSRLTEINMPVSGSNKRVKLKPVDEVLQLIHHQLALQIEPSHSDFKHIQFGVTRENFEKWINTITLSPVESRNGESVFELDEGVGYGIIPILDQLGIKDNLRFLLRYLDFYLNNYYMSVYRESSRSQCPISEEYVSSGRQAATTGIAYHLLIMETITEGFSIDFEALDKDIIESRISSGYTVLTDISSNIEHITLIFLDILSTVEMITPFALDESTNKITIKPKVLEILHVTTQLYNELKNKGPNTSSLFQQLQFLSYQYSPEHNIFGELMEAITTGIKNDSRELHGCPAHGIKDKDGISVFKSMFHFSITSFRNHYKTLRNKKLTNPGKDNISSKNENEVFGEEAVGVLEDVAKIGATIGALKSQGAHT